MQYIGFLFYGYAVTGVTAGAFKLDDLQHPTLCFYEQFSDQATALETLRRLIGTSPVCSIKNSVTEVCLNEPAVVQAMISGQTSAVAAELYSGRNVLLSYTEREAIAQIPEGPVFSEAACLVSAFRAAAQEQLEYNHRSLHIHQAARQVDAFLYEGSELVSHRRDVPEHDDRDAYLASVEYLLNENGIAGPVSLLTFSGGNPYCNLRHREHLNTDLVTEVCETIETSGLFGISLPDEGRRIIQQELSPHHRSGIPFVMYGALVQYLARQGADFRRIIQPVPVAVKKGEWFWQNWWISGPKAEVRGWRRYQGGVLSLVVLLALATTQFGFRYREEKNLDGQQATELSRKAGNEVMRKEVMSIRAFLDALNKRIGIAEKLSEIRKSFYTICTKIVDATPKGVTVSSIKISGRDVTITAYTTVLSAAQAQNKTVTTTLNAGGTEVPVANPAIDVAQPAIDFATNLEQSHLFSNLQNPYKASPERSEFTITCTYTGPVVTQSIETQAIPTLILQATQPAAGAPQPVPAK